MGSPYLTLALDGGGIRGAFTIRVVQRIDDVTGFLKGVKLIAGTSTGGIEALALAKGMSPKEIFDLYVRRGKDIFSSRDRLDRLSRLDELNRADYDIKKLHKVLQEELGETRLGELKKKVLIPTVDLDKPYRDGTPRRLGAKFFHNFSNLDRNVKIADLGARTAAAPTYFGSKDNYVDGGLAANSPGIHAAARAKKEGIPHEDIHLLSIGTSSSTSRYPGDHDQGLLWWAPKLIPILMDVQVGVSHYLCQQFFGDQYFRIESYPKKVVALDDVKSMDDLRDLADDYDIDPVINWLYKKKLFETTASKSY